MMKLLWIAGGIIGIAVALILVIGSRLPVAHQATMRTRLRATPREVFALITEVERFPAWRTGLDSATLLPSADGRVRFREKGADGTITYVMERVVPDSLVIMRIDDKTLPFGGKWTFEITGESPAQTSVSITEDGEVYNPVFRFISRFVMGHDRTLRQYLGDLERKLGITPEKPAPAGSA